MQAKSAASMAFCAGVSLATLQVSVAAEALVTQGPRVTFIAVGAKASSAQISSAPVPLSPGIFILPFMTKEQADGANAFKAQLQRVDASYRKVGDPKKIIFADTPSSFHSFARDGGVALANGKTQIMLPFRSAFPNAHLGVDVYGYYVDQAGNVNPEAAVLTNRLGNQTGPVVIPRAAGTAYLMYSDDNHEPGESDRSVYGRKLDGDGKATGQARLIERKNTGSQVALAGAQLANGHQLLVWLDVTPLPEPGQVRAIYRGRIVNQDGKNVGQPFILAMTKRNSGNPMGRMRVAALPNGSFVAVWVDQRRGWIPGSNEGVAYYQVFSEAGVQLIDAQLLGAKVSTRAYEVAVAALADSRFVVTATLVPTGGLPQLVAQLVAPDGQKTGQPLTLETFEDGSGGFDFGAFEIHSANAGYLLGTPPPTGLFTASDPRRVYVVWRVDNASGAKYRLFGQALRAEP